MSPPKIIKINNNVKIHDYIHIKYRYFLEKVKWEALTSRELQRISLKSHFSNLFPADKFGLHNKRFCAVCMRVNISPFDERALGNRSDNRFCRILVQQICHDAGWHNSSDNVEFAAKFQNFFGRVKGF